MNDISFKTLRFAAIVAALFGSTVGTALFLGDEVTAHPLRRLMGHEFHGSSEPVIKYLFIYPVIWIISLFGTLPGSIFIGIPAIYPIRNLIARRPLLFAIPTVLYAVALATLLLGWTITPTAYGVRFYETIWFYSAGSALGFVIALRWLSRPDWPAIFQTKNQTSH